MCLLVNNRATSLTSAGMRTRVRGSRGSGTLGGGRPKWQLLRASKSLLRRGDEVGKNKLFVVWNK